MFGVIIRDLGRTTTAGVRRRSLGAGGISHGGEVSGSQCVAMAISALYAPPAPYPDIPLLSSSDNPPLHPKTATSFSPFSHHREATPKSPPPPSHPQSPLPIPPLPHRPETLATLSPFLGLRHSVPMGHNRLSSSATAALQYTPVPTVGRDVDRFPGVIAGQWIHVHRRRCCAADQLCPLPAAHRRRRQMLERAERPMGRRRPCRPAGSQGGGRRGFASEGKRVWIVWCIHFGISCRCWETSRLHVASIGSAGRKCVSSKPLTVQTVVGNRQECPEEAI